MLCFFVVTKLLLLKLLLASISGLSGYEFGYHPSAEEFDNFMRETSRTWTRDLLANEHRRSWTNKPPMRDNAGFFVPKYNYEDERTRLASMQTASWPGYVERVGKPQIHQQRPQQHKQPAALTGVTLLNSNNIGSSLDFTMLSEENHNHDHVEVSGKPNIAEVLVIQQHEQPMSHSHVPHKNVVLMDSYSAAESSASPKPSTSLSVAPTAIPNKQTVGTFIEIATSEEVDKTPILSENYAADNIYKNNSAAHFPIFFTNPATGIVYAITEVGKVQDNVTHPNGSIPIYITKEQYDRDIYLQRKYYETSCKEANDQDMMATSAISVISAPSNTTTKPQIIRLQHPIKSVSKLPFAKLPTQLHKPPPVMVQTEVMISDQVHLPTRKKKTRNKRKKKKTNRPGRKPAALTYITTRPSAIMSKPTFAVPHILRGTRTPTAKPSSSTEKLQQLSTQLEKPSLTTTIFSKSQSASTSGLMNPPVKSNIYHNHRMRRRSVTNVREYMEQARRPAGLGSQIVWEPTLFQQRETKNVRNSRRRKGLPKHRNHTIRHDLNRIQKHNGTNGIFYADKNRTHVTRVSKKSSNTTQTPIQSSTNIAVIKTNTSVESTSRKNFMSTAKGRTTTRAKKKRKGEKRKNEKDSVFDLFDFDDDDDDDGDDDKDNDDADDDSYEDDSYFEYDQTVENTHKHSGSVENKEDYGEETTLNALREPLTQDNTSTAEEEADFGALEPEEVTRPTDFDASTNQPIYTKSSATKKRIRRRPSGASSTSYEDYDDDDGDGGGNAIGGFFRMMFYPVQIFMNGIADSFASKETEDDNPPFPTYTQYNNGIQPIESEEEEEQPNSLASWLSSWFGFNRRTKNIGSTTPLPAPIVAPTEAPSWFESWFGFGTKATSTETNEDDGNDDKWFFGWFDTKPKPQRKRKTTTTTTTVRTPSQVPILTIVDPLKNPQNWIGILAHHIINSTASTTHKPLMETITRSTINPDIPRKVSYDKYQIWRLKPLDDGQVRALEEYKKSDDGVKLQWLKGPSLRGLTDVLVPPKQLVDFEASLNFESIAHEVLIYDVGKAIAYEKAQELYHLNTTPRPNKNHKTQKYQPLNTISWHKYYEYDEIITHMEMLRMRHPQLIELIHIGRSYEGRPLVIVKLESRELAAHSANATESTHKKLKNKKKPKEANAVFIESGTHGLEWIGPATSLWMINELLRLIKSNKTSAEYEFIRQTTWYLMPILNPDGYVYTHQYDRFWRKTRSRHIARPGGIINSAMTWLQQKRSPERVCYGVDLDRNWHYQWGKRGSSKSPCNELYAGPGPLSEPETKALSEFLIDYRKQIKLYISMQAYGQIISYPMKANASFNAERIDDFLDVAMVGTDGLRKKGSKSRYKIDSISDLVENRSGCSDAFAAYEVGIPFSYTIQLADNGVHGYLLPSSSIEPTARDAFDIITAMVDYI